MTTPTRVYLQYASAAAKELVHVAMAPPQSRSLCSEVWGEVLCPVDETHHSRIWGGITQGKDNTTVGES